MVYDRRQFLISSMLTGAGAALLGATVGAKRRAQSEKLNVAVVGVANRGGDNLNGVSSLSSVNIVALCDVDDNYLHAAGSRFPNAKTYNDYRKMLEQKDIDAVVVSTPDHMHGPITLAAMEAGHDVYCKNPSRIRLPSAVN